MASSSGGKRLFSPQKWVPLRPQDVKVENIAQPRGKLPSLDPAVTQKVKVEPMSAIPQASSQAQPTVRRSFIGSHPANHLESDSIRAAGKASSEQKVVPFGFRDPAKAPQQKYRKNSMTGMAHRLEEPASQTVGTRQTAGEPSRQSVGRQVAEVPSRRSVGTRQDGEVPSAQSVGTRQVAEVPSDGSAQISGQDASVAAGSHVSLAPSVSPRASAAHMLLPNTAQPAAVAAAETAITIATISETPGLASTSSPFRGAETNAASPEHSQHAIRLSNREAMASIHKRVLSQYKAQETARNASVAVALREELHQAGPPENVNAVEHERRKTMITNAITRAKERISLVRDHQEKAPTFGRFSCWRRWRYNQRLKRAAKELSSALLTRLLQPRRRGGWCTLWMETLKAIEGAYGSAVMLTFAFLRWVFFLNIVLAAIWMGIVIIPFWVKPPPSFSWDDFWKPGFNAVVQGDALEKTWIFFGGYLYSRSDQPGRYRVDWAYPVTIAAMFLCSLVAILARISSRILGSGDSSVSYKSSVYPFSTVVFTSWDFHITSHEAATKLRRGIRNEIREMIADAVYKEKRKAGATGRDQLGYFALLVLWPLSLCASLAAVVYLVKYADRINAKIGTGFGQPLLLAALNVVGPMVTRYIVSLENWKPAKSHQILLVKLFLLRVVNLSTLIVRLFVMLDKAQKKSDGTSPYADCSTATTSCGDGFVCCTGLNIGIWKLCTAQQFHKCIPTCVENTVGLQLIRLVISTALINNALELIIGFGTLWILKSKRNVSVEDMALDVLYLEALVWIGACFAPATAPLAVLVNLLTFYCMKISLLYTCEPMEKRYSASKTSNITYGLMGFTLTLCSLPVSVLVVNRTTDFCGPIRDHTSMYSHLSGYIQDAPSVVWVILQWIGNVGVLWGILLILVVCIVLLRAKLVQSRQHLQMSRLELSLQKREVVERAQVQKSLELNLQKPVVVEKAQVQRSLAIYDRGRRLSQSSSFVV